MAAPDLIGPIMGTLLTCAQDALNSYSRPVGLVSLVPGGEVAWDNCCDDGGQLYVRLVEMYPSGRPFPNADGQAACAPVMLAARLAVGVIRCAHTVDDNGVPPSAAELTADALSMTADASILLEALKCCFPTSDSHIMKSLIGRWEPKGPSGGCAGGEWAVTVGFGTCNCP